MNTFLNQVARVPQQVHHSKLALRRVNNVNVLLPKVKQGKDVFQAFGHSVQLEVDVGLHKNALLSDHIGVLGIELRQLLFHLFAVFWKRAYQVGSIAEVLP